MPRSFLGQNNIDCCEIVNIYGGKLIVVFLTQKFTNSKKYEYSLKYLFVRMNPKFNVHCILMISQYCITID